MELDEKRWTVYYDSKLIYFFYFVQQDLYMKIVSNGKVFYKEKILENVVDYSIAIDGERKLIHLVAILLSGDLKYCIYKDNQWDWRYLSKYDSKTYRFKNLMLFITNQNIHILMAISNVAHPNLWILKHHYWDQKNWTNKKVCHIFTEKYDTPFQADMDQQENIHIVFRSLIHQKYQIFYCKHSSLYRIWNQPINISTSKTNHSHPFVFCDNQNKVHIAWCGFDKNDLAIYYLSNRKFDFLKNNWGDPLKLTQEGMNGIQPIIYQVDQNLKILWKKNNHQFVVKNFNLTDETWQDLKEIEVKNDSYHAIVSIIGKQYREYQNVKIPTAYGIINDDEIFLIGLDHKDTHKEIVNNRISEKKEGDNIRNPCLQEKNILKKEKTNIQPSLENFLKIMEELQNKQAEMNTLLSHLQKEQESNKEKINELAHLSLELNEMLRNNMYKRSFLEKIKKFFSD